jgi:hypothetical protein
MSNENLEETPIGSDRLASFDEGRSLCRDMDRLTQKIQLLFEAVGRLVDLQSELERKVTAALAEDAPADYRTH